MKKNKLLYVLLGVLVLVGIASFSYALAENNNNNNDNSNSNVKSNDKSNEDHGDNIQAKEAKQRGTTLEVHISNKGKVDVRGAKVTVISGNTVNATTSWGVANLSWSVNVLSDTKMIKRSGSRSLISEISVGDLINFQGNLLTTSASPIVVNATMIKNWSLPKKNSSFNGTVKSVDATNLKFTLGSDKNGDITVVTSSSTKFEKREGVGAFTDIVVGAKVLAKGFYDSQLKQLTASEIKVYVPEVVRTNIDGKIKSLPGVTAPTSMVITSGDKDYTVNIATDTSILKSSWLKVALSALKVGDKVKVYGVVNSNMTIDATIVRDANL